MATSTISNTITGPTGTAVSGARVVARLMPTAGFRSDTFTEVARVVETTTDGSGAWSLALERNSNITPANTYYQIIEHVPDSVGGQRVWNISVGASNQTVYAALVDPLPDATGGTYLTQASADARYQALSSIGTDTPSTIDPDDAASAGVSTAASRGDHQHAITAAAPSNIGLAGTNSEGAATSFARSNHVHAYNPPACRVYRSTNQSISNNTLTVVTFDSERYDTDSMHDTSSLTSRITFNTAGIYVVTANIVWQAGASYTRRIIDILLDGTTIIARASYEGASETLNNDQGELVTTTYKLTAGQYVECRVFHTNGGSAARNVMALSNYSPEFSATWVGVG